MAPCLSFSTMTVPALGSATAITQLLHLPLFWTGRRGNAVRGCHRRAVVGVNDGDGSNAAKARERALLYARSAKALLAGGVVKRKAGRGGTVCKQRPQHHRLYLRRTRFLANAWPNAAAPSQHPYISSSRPGLSALYYAPHGHCNGDTAATLPHRTRPTWRQQRLAARGK